MIPNLEAISALYKAFYDIDAYPVILDKEIMNGSDDYLLIIDNLSTTYKVIPFLFLDNSIGGYWRKIDSRNFIEIVKC